MQVIRRTMVQPNVWLLREPAADARARLFCLPYSGCGATMYRRWPRFIGGVEVCAVQPPGRESRFREPHYGTIEELADQLVAALSPYLDRPFAFFGHCGSALTGYETSARLLERGAPLPSNLFISSQVAPHEGPYGRWLELSDDGLRAELVRLMIAVGGEPLEDLIEVYLDILRADIGANKRYTREAVRLPHPLTAIGWDRDNEVAHHLMAGWSACGQAEFEVFPGEHYTFLEAPEALLETIRRRLDPGVKA